MISKVLNQQKMSLTFRFLGLLDLKMVLYCSKIEYFLLKASFAMCLTTFIKIHFFNRQIKILPSDVGDAKDIGWYGLIVVVSESVLLTIVLLLILNGLTNFPILLITFL